MIYFSFLIYHPTTFVVLPLQSLFALPSLLISLQHTYVDNV